MPGIVGLITKRPQDKSKAELNLMLATLMHERFYTSGTYINESMGLYAGWVSHESSFSDCMPIFNENRELVLLFSGQNFAETQVTDQLKRQGHEFDRSNASYLIHLYEEEQENFFGCLNGWFHGLLVDTQKRKLILFNDRFGVGRVYYYEGKDAFYFSSEAKSLLQVRPELRQVDLKSLGEFFSCDCALENRTLFSNIFLLPSGASWTFENVTLVSKGSYFSLDAWEHQDPLNQEAFFRAIEETFQGLLSRYFNVKQPVGMSLTGGLDSRMIMACLDLLPGQLPCYTFGGIAGETYDVRIARQVAEACGQPHTVLRLDQNFLSNFPVYAEETVYVTDGCHSVCGAHDVFFNRLAREIAPIRMSGKFGSEIVRGTSQFKTRLPSEALFDPDFYGYVLEAGKTLSNISGGNKVSFAAFKEMPWHEYGCLAIEQMQLTIETPFVDNDLVNLMYQGISTVSDPHQIPLHIIKHYKPKLLDTMTDRGFRGNSSYLVSRCSELFYGYLLFKADWFFNYTPLKYSRTASFLEQYNVGRLFTGRHLPARYCNWFRTEFSEYLCDVLLDMRTTTRPFFNSKSLERIVLSHLRGTRSYLTEINKALSAELICRRLIEDI